MENGVEKSSGVINSIIDDLNAMIKETMNGQYIQACCRITGAVQKLISLRAMIENQQKNKEESQSKPG